jgi:hypothetical protein
MTVIYRKIINNEDMEKLQNDVDRLGELGGWKCYENKTK